MAERVANHGQVSARVLSDKFTHQRVEGFARRTLPLLGCFHRRLVRGHSECLDVLHEPAQRLPGEPIELGCPMVSLSVFGVGVLSESRGFAESLPLRYNRALLNRALIEVGKRALLSSTGDG